MENVDHCVRCGAPKSTGPECPKCGVIYAKAEQKYEPPPPSLVPCSACGKDVSINASSCPNCGEPMIDKQEKKAPEAQPVNKVRSFLGAAFLVGVFILFVYSQLDTNATMKDTSTQQVTVTSNEYGDRWPYTIPEGKLCCVRKVRAGHQEQYVILEYAGTAYALNGSARSSGKYQPLEKIWRENPTIPGSKMPDPGIIQRGLSLCN